MQISINAETTLERAKRSLICSPFCLPLFASMLEGSVSLFSIAGSNGLKHGYTKKKMSEISVDSELDWLIQTGVLRREVDGQGLTDSFRLTPLGKKIIMNYKETEKNFPKAFIWQRIANFYSRWFRLAI